MKGLFYAAFFTLALFGCQSAKKSAKTAAKEQETQAEYDYRTALQAYKIGINYIHNNEIHEAIIHLEKAVQLDGSNFRYRHGLGLAYSLNGQIDEAIEQLEESLSIDPNFAESNNLLGSIYGDIGEYDKAVECLRKVIQDKSFAQPQFAYFNLGKIKRQQGRQEEAIAAFKLAYQNDPGFYRPYIALGEIYKERKDFANMLYFYQKAEPGNPSDVNVLFNIGYALFRLGQYERAKSYLAQVSILFPPPNIDKPTQDMLGAIENIMRNQRN